jgi:hypothetical protein
LGRSLVDSSAALWYPFFLVWLHITLPHQFSRHCQYTICAAWATAAVRGLAEKAAHRRTPCRNRTTRKQHEAKVMATRKSSTESDTR